MATAGTSRPRGRLSSPLQTSRGLTAWQVWVEWKNGKLNETDPQGRIPRIRADIAQIMPPDLKDYLGEFIENSRRTHAVQLYYNCLGLQLHLHQKQRHIYIFNGYQFETFTERFHEIILEEESLEVETERFEEEILWQARELGGHSPYSLLNWVMYYNAKRLGDLKAESHMQLSFNGLITMMRNDPLPSLENDLPNYRRSRVLFGLYAGKCPEACRSRNDVLYLIPKDFVDPDDKCWYVELSLSMFEIKKMLRRFRFIEEIHRAQKRAANV